MTSLIFVLLVKSHEYCTSQLVNSPMGNTCVGARFKRHNTYLVNSKPCWDEGMNKEITETELKKYTEIFKVIVNPDGYISYCPGKSRYKKANENELVDTILEKRSKI
jgi:hypothetical protein